MRIITSQAPKATASTLKSWIQIFDERLCCVCVCDGGGGVRKSGGRVEDVLRSRFFLSLALHKAAASIRGYSC